MFSSASNLGVVSEALDAMVAHYYDKIHLPQTPATHRLTREQVTTTVHMKALDSIVNPGEAVGALCAQVRGSLVHCLTHCWMTLFADGWMDGLVYLLVYWLIDVLTSPQVDLLN